MANEYLQRTVTSTGNRKVWTWAGWLKISNTGTLRLLSPGGSGNQGYLGFVSNGIYFIDYDGSTYWSFNANQLNRDVASWMHLLVSVDTTQEIDKERVRLYLNGTRITKFSTETYPTKNYSSYYNASAHYIGRRGYDLNDTFDGELADLFFVDGQALTPDVFGFYKEGKGYISAGSTQATDFRPGQWVPKTPRVIKAQIERNGGFGVNGFYLPMNDSSNFGADFHCEPNSIITLKGEDLPQPRNGAPTTSDAYVSQLRADPYAANLVLAVPGISGGTSSGFGDYSADIKGSGSNKTPTLQGSISIASTASYYGSAGNFDGSDDRLDFSSDADFALPGDFTMEMWVNWKTVGNGQLLSAGPGNNTGAFYWQYYSSQFQFGTQSVATDNVVSFTPVANQWYHLAAERQGTVLTQYVNGVAVGVSTNVTQSYAQGPLYVGWAGAGYINAYIQDLRVYKGVAKYKGGFDVPKPYTPVGIATWRAVPDCTANNFATLNPLTISNTSLTNGNLTMSPAGNNATAWSTFAVKSGKWYWEVYKSGGDMALMLSQLARFNGYQPGFDTTSLSLSMYYANGGESTNRFTYNSSNTAFPSGFGDDDNGTLYNFFLDFDTNTFKVRRNNDATTEASFSMPSALVSEPLFIGYSVATTWPAGSFTYNFGQNPTFSGNTTAGTYTDSNGKGLFKYQPPSGFLALCEDNLPTPAISDPGEHFKTVLYTGNGSSGRSITGIGFTPDLVWTKGRTVTTENAIYDSVRGGTRYLSANGTGAEQTVQGVISFNNDGFSAGTDSETNGNGINYTAWCWRAGAGTTSTNTDGSIQSVVSVNQDAGFSIVSYTGNGSVSSTVTVGHGLGKTPDFIITKKRSGGTDYGWSCWHKSLGGNYGIWLDKTSARNASMWAGYTNFSSTVFSPPDLLYGNESNQTYINYCWAEIEGFSKFGSYVGNLNANGPMVWCGFKPAWLLVKRTDTTDNWIIKDSSRGSSNPNDPNLYPNLANIETTASVMHIDFLSNGFKVRGDDTSINASGGTYIFAAFAESPFSYSNSK